MRKVYGASGKWKEVLRTDADLDIARALYGRYLSVENRYTRMDMAGALALFSRRITDFAKARIASKDPDQLFMAYRNLSFILWEASQPERSGYGAGEPKGDKRSPDWPAPVMDGIIRAKETMAQLLAGLEEPVFLKKAGQLYEDIIAFREQKMREDESGANMAALSEALVGAGNVAALDASEEGRRKAVSLMSRGIRMAQQRAVLLGTEESLRSLAACYEQLRAVYESFAGQDSGKQAIRYSALIGETVLRLYRAAASRWPSEEIAGKTFDAGVRAVELWISAGESSDLKRALKLVGIVTELANANKGQWYYAIKGRITYARLFRAAGWKNTAAAKEITKQAYSLLEKYLEETGQYSKTGSPKAQNTWDFNLFDLAELKVMLAEIMRAETLPSGKADTGASSAPASWAAEEVEELNKALVLTEYLEAVSLFEKAGTNRTAAQARLQSLSYTEAAQIYLELSRELYTAIAYCRQAEDILKPLLSQYESASDWELFTKLIRLRCACLRRRDEAGRKEAAGCNGILRDAAIHAFRLRPSIGNLRSVADAFEQECVDIMAQPAQRTADGKLGADQETGGSEVSSGRNTADAVRCLTDAVTFMRRTIRTGQCAGADACALLVRFSMDLTAFYMRESSLSAWENSIRFLQEGLHSMRLAAEGTGRRGDWQMVSDHCGAAVRLLKEYEAEKTPRLTAFEADSRKAVCWNGMANIDGIYLDAWRHLSAGEGEDQETVLNSGVVWTLLNMNTAFRNAEHCDSGTYLDGIRETGYDAAEAAEALVGKDPSAENRTYYVLAACGLGSGLSLRAGGNDRILETLLKAEPVAKQLAREGAEGAAENYARLCGLIADAYSKVNPVRYALRIREYRNKAR